MAQLARRARLLDLEQPTSQPQPQEARHKPTHLTLQEVTQALQATQVQLFPESVALMALKQQSTEELAAQR